MLLDFKSLVSKYNLKFDGAIHVGASTGQEAKVYHELGIKPVLWIEALPEVYEELCKNIKKYPLNTALCACVSDKIETITFHVSNNEKMSSSMLEFGTHKDVHPDVVFTNEITLTTTTLSDIIGEEKFENFILNCDLQGAELLALKGLGEKINYFSALYLEVNKKETYKGCALVEDIDSYVGQYGFKRVETGSWIGDTWSDALYLKL